MTLEEREAARRMRQGGATLRETAKAFGVSAEWIRQITVPPESRTHRKKRYEGFIFPNIVGWMRENRYSCHRFAVACGTDYMTMYRYLSGKNDIPKRYIDAILAVTGMDYAEAFWREKKAAPESEPPKAAQENTLS